MISATARRLKSLGILVHDGFFGRISAIPFGLLRISWATAAFCSIAFLWPNLRLFFTDQGVFPPEWAESYARTDYRFTLLEYVHDPLAVEGLVLLFLFASFCMIVGYRTRLVTILTVVMLNSLQEHSYAMFAGGDSVLRVTGLILLVSPGIKALSLDRLFEQEHLWVKEQRTLPRPTMPSWPRLLLTWQMIIIYVTAAWYKLLDPMWQNGSATVAAMFHDEFTRFGPHAAQLFTYFTVPLSWGTIAWQLLWVTFLVPLRWRRMLPTWLRGYRRWMLLVGFVFHLLIFIFMDAGIFSIAMFGVYPGVLDQDDYDAIATWINRRVHWKGRIAVLYDGHCSFCRRTVLPLLLGDWLGRIEGVNFRDQAKRSGAAPDLKIEDLDEALHVRFPDGRTAAGFDAVRLLSWHLPWLWPMAPFFYIPGVAPLGRSVYRKVAMNRYCLLKSGNC